MTSSPTVSAPGELHLVTFKLNNYEYGVEVAGVYGIYHGLAIIPTPDECDAFTGEVQLLSRRIAVVNLRRVLNLNEQMTGPGWLLIVQQAGQMVAVLVDQISDVIRVKPQALQAITQKNQQVPAFPWLTASARYQERTIYLPDLTRLLTESLA